MKKYLVVLIVILSSSFAYSQISFGVSTDFMLKGTSIGYKINNFIPYVGFQYYNASVTTESNRKYYDYETEGVVTVNDKYEFGASIMMPSIGVKYLFDLEAPNVKPFLNAAIFKPSISARAKLNGTEEKEITDQIEATSIFGFEFGFGVEYYFDKNFSLGGEFGFRSMMISNESDYPDDYYDPDIGDYIDYTAKTSIDIGLGMTYTRINLTYFLGL